MGTVIGKKGMLNFSYQFRFTNEQKEAKLVSLPTGVPIPWDKGVRAMKAAREAASIKGRRLEEDYKAKRSGRYADHSDDTLSEYAEYYLEEQRAAQNVLKIKTDSLASVESYLRLHVLPYLGAIKLSDLSSCHIESWLTELVSECHRRAEIVKKHPDAKDNKKPFYRSLKKILRALAGMLSHAIEREYIYKNVATMRKMYKVILESVPQEEPNLPPTFDEVTEILKAVKGLDIETPVTLMAYYGLRRSEALGLRWENVTPDKLLIRDTIIKMSDSILVFRESNTKSKYSRRDLPLNQFMSEYLEKVKAKQEQDKQLFGNCYKDDGFVCAVMDGKPFAPDLVSHKFKKALKSHGLPIVPLEKLRNAVACQLFEATYSAELVGMWLGHSPRSVTEAHYIDPRVGKSLLRVAEIIQMGAERRQAEA